MLKRTTKGFTLIELLVVIAIIGILSSIVLASLNSARTKANNSKIKAQLATLRAAAELYYDGNGSAYAAGTCVSGAPTGMFADSASGLKNLGDPANYPAGTTMDCGGSATAYSAAARNADGSLVWCVDSTGTSRGATATGVAYTGLIGASPAAHAAAGSTVCQ